MGFCNSATWYLSCDFFYFALFPFTAVAYGKHKVRNCYHCLFHTLLMFRSSAFSWLHLVFADQSVIICGQVWSAKTGFIILIESLLLFRRSVNWIRMVLHGLDIILMALEYFLAGCYLPNVKMESSQSF